jgi:hypothetical protein
MKSEKAHNTVLSSDYSLIRKGSKYFLCIWDGSSGTLGHKALYVIRHFTSSNRIKRTVVETARLVERVSVLYFIYAQ